MADQPIKAVSTGADDESPASVAGRWISEIQASQKDSKPWATRAKKIVKRYKEADRSDSDQTRRFSILWSNIQTLGPAVYARPPQPIVMRRFKDEDAVSRTAADVLERAIAYSCEAYDLGQQIELTRDDFLLVGRGQAWIRYEPHFKTVQTPVNPVGSDGNAFVAQEGVEISDDVSEFEDATGQRHDAKDVKHDDENGHHIEEQALDYEEVDTDHVAWDDFFTNPARTWNEVRWCARRAFLTRKECVARFGAKIGNAVPLDWEAKKDKTSDDGKDDQFKKAAIYEVWDKESEQALWISLGYPTQPLDVRDDPLELDGFFPCPMPLLATTAPDSMIPVPDFVYYQDQADELDELTAKIGVLQDALRLVGFYAGDSNVILQEVFTKGQQNKLVALPDFASFKSGGGSAGMIEWVPIDMVMEALKGCIETRQQVLEDIYQITGLSDIIRGASDPSETATAQGIKAQWGSLRVRDRQKSIARFARDIVRIKGEVIAGKFQVETLKAITGIQLLDTPEQKAQVQQQAQAAQMAQQAPQGPPQPGQPPAPPMPQAPAPDPAQMALLDLPTWAEVDQLLKNAPMRRFRIDIETDSTIEPNENEDKARFTEFVTAFTGFLGTAAQILPAYPPAAPIFGEIAKEAACKFRVSPALEEVIDKVFGQIEKMPPQAPAQQDQKPPPPPPDPAEQQAKIMTAQAHQTKAQASIIDAQVNAQRAQTEQQEGQQDIRLRENEQAMDAEALRQQATRVNVNLGEGAR